MKRFLCLIIVLVLFPCLCFADSTYSPALNMTIDDFISKYNAIGAPLKSSYTALESPVSISMYSINLGYALLSPDSKSEVYILLYSADPKASIGGSNIGLDEIQVFMMDPTNFMPFLSISTRCASLFTDTLFGFDPSSHYVDTAIKDYYENGSPLDQAYYVQINSDNDIYVKYFINGGYYYIDICKGMV